MVFDYYTMEMLKFCLHFSFSYINIKTSLVKRRLSYRLCGSAALSVSFARRLLLRQPVLGFLHGFAFAGQELVNKFVAYLCKASDNAVFDSLDFAIMLPSC